MSTRGMIGVKVNDTLMGTYNHFDSYPTGLGQEMVGFAKNFLNTQPKVDAFAAKMLQLKVVDSQDLPTPEDVAYYMSLQAKGEIDEREEIGGKNRAVQEYYALLRNYQGLSGLQAILTGELRHWMDGKDFIEDSLFCEYAYIFNLDTKKLEFYVGFQKTGKKVSRDGGNGKVWESDEYGPCKMLGEIPFNKVSKPKMLALYKAEEGEEE